MSGQEKLVLPSIRIQTGTLKDQRARRIKPIEWDSSWISHHCIFRRSSWPWPKHAEQLVDLDSCAFDQASDNYLRELLGYYSCCWFGEKQKPSPPGSKETFWWHRDTVFNVNSAFWVLCSQDLCDSEHHIGHPDSRQINSSWIASLLLKKTPVGSGQLASAASIAIKWIITYFPLSSLLGAEWKSYK